MSRIDEFTKLVQTAAIVESLYRGQQPNKPSPALMATIAVHAAMKVDESQLPESLTEACEKHIEYVYGASNSKPFWLIGIL